MRRCVDCKRIAIFLTLNSSGRCDECAKAKQQADERARREERLRKIEERRAREQAEQEQTRIRRQARIETLNTAFLERLSKVPVIPLDDKLIKSPKQPPAREPWPSASNVTKRTSFDSLGNFVSVDIDTTGLDPRSASIISFAFMRWRNWEPVEAITSLVSTKRSVSPAAFRVNKITDEMLVGKPTFPMFIPAITEFIGADPLVGHNVYFALDFLTYNGVHVFDLARKVYDTQELAEKTWPNSFLVGPNYPLLPLCQSLDIRDEMEDHQSLYDALAIGELFRHCCVRRTGQALKETEE